MSLSKMDPGALESFALHQRRVFIVAEFEQNGGQLALSRQRARMVSAAGAA
jgi:hypothetical protein